MAMTDPRVEAAAKVINPLPQPWKSLSEAQREYYRGRANDVVIAVDDCDRVAGRITIDTNDDEFATNVALSLGFSARSREHDLRMVRRVFDAVRVAAAGAQPPPKEDGQR
jgi:hypothetical protein